MEELSTNNNNNGVNTRDSSSKLDTDGVVSAKLVADSTDSASKPEDKADRSENSSALEEATSSLQSASMNESDTIISCLMEGDLILYKDNIGNGAFASVHRAKYKDEECAAKMLLQHAKNMLIGSTSPVQSAVKESILKECSFLEKLQHVNVIRHITTAIEPKSALPVLVMELMDCSLKRFIVENRSLDLKLQLTICHAVSSGLHYLHSKNIIHRDLCDDNVLLKQTPKLFVKISDFGMSKILNYESMSATMTAVGHRKGYLPPEGQGFDSSSDSDSDMKDSSVRYSHHLDIYSFGAVATQTVRSADQFKSRKELKRAFKEIESDHPLQEVIESCIDKDSKKRPKAKEVSETIAVALESLEEGDPAAGFWRETNETMRKQKNEEQKTLQVKKEERKRLKEVTIREIGSHRSYHNCISKEEAERRLRLICEHSKSNHCYLTRYNSAQKSYMLSVYRKQGSGGTAWHFTIIVLENGRVMLERLPRQFLNLQSLLTWYENTRIDPTLPSIGIGCTEEDCEAAEGIQARQHEMREEMDMMRRENWRRREAMDRPPQCTIV